MIRVTGGALRGLRLRTPPEHITRPPSDRVRQAVFNILGSRVLEAQLLDLFAGSGSYSIEALSRGAAHATLVELHPRARQVIATNLAHAGLTEHCRLLAGDVLQIVPRLGGPYSLVIIAPPHFANLLDITLGTLEGRPLLAPDSTILVQHHQREEPCPRWESLVRFRQDRYGTTVLSWYQPR